MENFCDVILMKYFQRHNIYDVICDFLQLNCATVNF